MTTTPTYSTDNYLSAENPGVARLLDNVQATVPAVTLEMVKLQAWNAIEQFYLDSTVQREKVYWQLAIGAQELDFNPFSESWLVAWVLDVRGLYCPRIIMPGTVIDTQPPTSVRNGSALLALRPVGFDGCCSTLPPELWAQWFQTVLAGTLSKLYAQPSKPYSSPQLAQFYGAQFRQGIARARDIARREYTDGPGRWKFPLFAHGKRKN